MFNRGSNPTLLFPVYRSQKRKKKIAHLKIVFIFYFLKKIMIKGDDQCNFHALALPLPILNFKIVV